MTRHIPIIVFVFLPLFLMRAGDDEKKIAFKVLEHDFGTLKQGTTVEYMFEFTNTSADTIFLDKPRASCGCTAALMSDEMLLPGATGTVKVRFTPPVGFHGNVTKTVSLYTLPDGNALEVLRIRARVIGDLEPERDIIRFNAVTGEKRVETVKLTSIADKPVSLDNISASLMEYRDTTAGDRYHSDKVIAKPFTNFALSTTELVLQPGATCELRFVFTGEEKGQINGSIRIATGKYETIISVAGIVMRKKSDNM